MARTRRTYTREFKLAAVQLITVQGYSFAEAAKCLGIGETLLRNWNRKLDAEGKEAFPGHGHRPPLEEENHRLRAENKRLRMERDILKKATAFFAAEAR
jgi:transposase